MRFRQKVSRSLPADALAVMNVKRFGLIIRLSKMPVILVRQAERAVGERRSPMVVSIFVLLSGFRTGDTTSPVSVVLAK